ncbi:ribonuclease P protein component [Nocardioides stalactiti]|uniref:ribonuclease P protein component n=1 Tax=Nocardioides stalactiti TaxID=2755356 RepID=UPI0016040755|nr:ribonuclease P protein component [Nocardioides stalactiti]
MLPPDRRLTRPTSFRHAIKAGRRSGSRTLVTHLAVAEEPVGDQPRIGFVVSKAVGNAVTRNRVKRRLRHAAAPLHDRLPADALLVVRAQPAAAAASAAELAADLERCLDKSLGASVAGSEQVAL